MSPVEGHRALPVAAINGPMPTITAVACPPGYLPKKHEMQKTDFRKKGNSGLHLQEKARAMNHSMYSMFVVTSMLQFVSGLAYGSCLFSGEDKGTQALEGIFIGVHALCVSQHF